MKQELPFHLKQEPLVASSNSIVKNEVGENSPTTSQTPMVKSKKKRKCLVCLKFGHKEAKCPDLICKFCSEKGHAELDCQFKKLKCLVCNEVGHKAEKCPELTISRHGCQIFPMKPRVGGQRNFFMLILNAILGLLTPKR